MFKKIEEVFERRKRIAHKPEDAQWFAGEVIATQRGRHKKQLPVPKEF